MIGDTGQLFQLIQETGIRKSAVDETISEKDGSMIYSQFRKLDTVQLISSYSSTTGHPQTTQMAN